MQIWQLFIILRQPVAISVTVFSNPTKLTNDLFISPNQNINRSLAKTVFDSCIVSNKSGHLSQTAYLGTYPKTATGKDTELTIHNGLILNNNKNSGLKGLGLICIKWHAVLYADK